MQQVDYRKALHATATQSAPGEESAAAVWRALRMSSLAATSIGVNPLASTASTEAACESRMRTADVLPDREAMWSGVAHRLPPLVTLQPRAMSSSTSLPVVSIFAAYWRGV